MDYYSPFNKALCDLQTADLSALKQTSEGWYVEYKRQMPKAVAVAKSLSAFANTYGGWLFVGVEETSKEKPVAGAFPGVPKEDIDAALQLMRKSAADLLNPSPHFDTKILLGPDSELGLLENRAIVCAWVPKSTNTPHVHKSGMIYRRVSDSSEPTPENDRFVLDQLWRRADDVKRRSKEWYDRDPEFSPQEKLQPYARIMLVADKRAERDIWITAEDDAIRSVFGLNGMVSRMPFDTIYTSSEGLVARQLSSNDPSRLGLTWRMSRNLTSDVIVPLQFYQPDLPTGLVTDLEGYDNVDQFIKVLDKYNISTIRVVDLNYLFPILTGVAEIQQRLCALAGWSEEYHVKVKVLNAWRTIPFVDSSLVLEEYEKYGLPMCLDSVSSTPYGTGPDAFLAVPTYSETKDVHARAYLQAAAMFVPAAYAFGVLPCGSLDEKSTDVTYYEALENAGRRAVGIVQDFRIERLKTN